MTVCITVMFVLKSSIWFLSWFSSRRTHQTWEQTSKAVAKHWAMSVENRSPTRGRQTNAKLPNHYECSALFLHLIASVKHQNQYCTCQFTLNLLPLCPDIKIFYKTELKQITSQYYNSVTQSSHHTQIDTLITTITILLARKLTVLLRNEWF